VTADLLRRSLNAATKQKRLQFRKTGMKAFDEFRPALAGRTGLILLFAEKLSNCFDDEHNQPGILTSASNLIPPSRFRWHWNL
jgi:hypothetical protein